MLKFLIAASIVAIAAPADARSHAFPGEPRQVRSPDGAVTVLWWEPDAASPRHSLLLKAASSPKSWRIHEFDRSVVVAWSPRGHLLAVTDRMSSDGSTTRVHDPDTGNWTDACVTAVTALGTRWARAHHRYCEHLDWAGPRQLRLRLWGYGDGVDFDTRVVVPIGRHDDEMQRTKPATP